MELPGPGSPRGSVDSTRKRPDPWNAWMTMQDRLMQRAQWGIAVAALLGFTAMVRYPGGQIGDNALG